MPYRRFVYLSLLISRGLLLLIVLPLILFSPTQELASIRFHLEFEGAISGLYPNGSPFSTADITAPPYNGISILINETEYHK
jgi:hypothetical protein